MEERQFRTKLYDRRDAFSFAIVNFPNLSGNIPKKTSYGVFISQLLRYSTACMEYKDFAARCEVLVEKLVRQNYERKELLKTFKRFMKKYKDRIDRYGQDTDMDRIMTLFSR